jgi:hypothetical protein
MPANQFPDSLVREANRMEQQFVAERVENRVGMKLTAMLIGTHGKLGVEKAVTENVSPRGVRVISTSDWYIDDTILVSLPAGHFTSAARVAYCDALGQGTFGIGLEFVGSGESLEMSALSSAPEILQS